jgi:LysR family nitrogen assimilation transcriptional regulator
MTISQRQLHYFIAVVEAGSFSRAAKAMGVAQSALSHQIAELESLLGTRLLDRKARGTVTTAAGERLFGHAKSISAAISNAEFDVRTFSQRPTGMVTVVMAHPVIDPLTVPFLKAVREQLPDVQIALHEFISTAAVERLLSGLSDFALVYDPAPHPRLEMMPVIEEELFLVGPRDMIGDSDAPVRLASLGHAPVLPPRPPRHQRQLKKRLMLRDRVAASDWVEIDSHAAIRRMVAAGLACTIVTRASVESELRDGTLHSRPIHNPSVLWNLHLAWSVDRPHTKAFLAIRELLLAVIQSEVASGRWPGRWIANRDPTPITSFTTA